MCSCVASGKGLAAVNYLLLLVLPGEMRKALAWANSKRLTFKFAAFTGIRVYALRKNLLLSLAAASLSTVPLGVNFVNPLPFKWR